VTEVRITRIGVLQFFINWSAKTGLRLVA